MAFDSRECSTLLVGAWEEEIGVRDGNTPPCWEPGRRIGT
jgi:hypothetical protein